MISIAKAIISNLDEISKMGNDFYHEGQIPTKFVPDKFKKTWSGLMESDTGIIFVMKSDNNITGILGGVKYYDPNSYELIASEFFWYVKRGYRGYGIKLLKEFEAWAKEQGATKIIMMHLSKLMPDKLKKFYSKIGYKELETHYIKEINT